MSTITSPSLSALGSQLQTRIPKFSLRQTRALWALWEGPKMREALDKDAGVSNSPQLVANLMKKGVDINCTLVDRVDRDGRTCHPGSYSLTEKGRTTLQSWHWGEDSMSGASMATYGAEFCAAVKDASAELRKAAR